MPFLKGVGAYHSASEPTYASTTKENPTTFCTRFLPSNTQPPTTPSSRTTSVITCFSLPKVHTVTQVLPHAFSHELALRLWYLDPSTAPFSSIALFLPLITELVSNNGPTSPRQHACLASRRSFPPTPGTGYMLLLPFLASLPCSHYMQWLTYSHPSRDPVQVRTSISQPQRTMRNLRPHQPRPITFFAERLFLLCFTIVGHRAALFSISPSISLLPLHASPTALPAHGYPLPLVWHCRPAWVVKIL